MLTYSAFLYSP